MGFTIGNLTRLPLGWQGESNSRLIDIDMSEWLRDWPGAKVDLLIKRPGEETYSPVKVKMQGGHLLWVPTRADVLIAGKGRAQIILTDAGDVEMRTRVVETIIGESMKGTEGEAPDPVQGWLHEVLQAAQDAREAVDKMPRIGENGNWWIWDAEADAFVDTGIVADVDKVVKLKNLVDGSAAGSVKNVRAMEDGEELTDGTEYKQGIASSSLGVGTAATGGASTALGMGTESHGTGSLASGMYSRAYGDGSIATGVQSEARGVHSVAMGGSAEADGDNSVAMGKHVVAKGDCQTVIGRQNEWDEEGKYAFIIGNGDANTTGPEFRKNAFAVDWEGNVHPSGAFIGGMEVPEGKAIKLGKDAKIEDSDGNVLLGHSTVLILPPTDLVPMDGMFSQPNPWVQDMVVGGVYDVTYNGTVYECEAYDYHEMQPDAPEGVLILGNIALTGGTGGNPDAPFVMLAYPNSAGAEAGLYGMLIPGDGATAVTMGITGKETGVETPEVLYPVNVEVTANASNTFDFGACDKTWAEIAAAYAAGKTLQVKLHQKQDGGEMVFPARIECEIVSAGALTGLTVRYALNMYANNDAVRLMAAADDGGVRFVDPN